MAELTRDMYRLTYQHSTKAIYYKDQRKRGRQEKEGEENKRRSKDAEDWQRRG